MERIYLLEIFEDLDFFLLRWVDDFFVIIFWKNLVDKFLNVMYVGIFEYGCFINYDKMLINYDVVVVDGCEVKRVGVSERFFWCGFLLDIVIFEVFLDFFWYIGEC